MEEHEAHPWRTVEELVEIGYQRSRVVMMNECHVQGGRCIRTRSIGQRILPSAHRLGVRHLAMEPLYPLVVEEANRTRRLPENTWESLQDPEMREFIQTALDLGWTLIAYEADGGQEPPGLSLRQGNNWREEQQAQHLTEALATLPQEEKLLVWCGNNHHDKVVVPAREGESDEFYGMMGYHFRQKSGINHFAIDQCTTVQLPRRPTRAVREKWLAEVTPTLITFGGTAGFLTEEAPISLPVSEGTDAYVASLDNAME
jgi:hypothetical protein